MKRYALLLAGLMLASTVAWGKDDKDDLEEALGQAGQLAWQAGQELAQTPMPAYARYDRIPNYVLQKVLRSVVMITVIVRQHKETQRYDEITDSAGGRGSGFIVDESGLIVTNAHVVRYAGRLGHRQDKAEDGGTVDYDILSSNITVQLNDGQQLMGELVDFDERGDLALLRIDPSRALTSLSPVPLASGEPLQVGDQVVAIGSPYGHFNSSTFGSISYLGRKMPGCDDCHYDDYIQTDASINHGNSGGPLVNAEGAVLGVNSLIFTHNDGFIGLGYAIPVKHVREMLERYKNTGRIHETNSGLEVATNLSGGVRVESIFPGSPAYKAARIFQGDVIVAVDGVRLVSTDNTPANDPAGESVDAFRHAIKAKKPGETARLTVLRGLADDPKKLDVDVQLY